MSYMETYIQIRFMSLLIVMAATEVIVESNRRRETAPCAR